MIVNDDTNEEGTSGRKVLWDTVGFLEPALWFGKSTMWSWVESIVKWCLPARPLGGIFPGYCEWSHDNHGEGFPPYHKLPLVALGKLRSPWPWSPGKQVRLGSFTAKSPCWIFALSILGLWNITTPKMTTPWKCITHWSTVWLKTNLLPC